MKTARNSLSRREFSRRIALATGGIAFGFNGGFALAQTKQPTRIGIIGAGNIGGAIGKLWAQAGHEVLFASRNPDELKGLVTESGPKTAAGFPKDAAEFGPVVFLAVPYGAIPQIGKDFGSILEGKVVIDCSNPSPRRDGAMAEEARQKGSGVATAEYIPGARVTRAFGTINFKVALDNAHRPGDKLAIPIAGDDPEALRITSDLVTDAGFDPVIVGGLARSKEFDYGAPGSGKNTTAVELRKILKL
jgi:8-hydroxy-5-deazaflavin:NADPH oxidoreductase